MSTQIFITPPVADEPRSLAFYKTLGYSHNAHFTDDTAACIIISEHIQIMLLTHSKFREFSPKDICDTSKTLQVLHSLTCESRAEVDEFVRKDIATELMARDRQRLACIGLFKKVSHMRHQFDGAAVEVAGIYQDGGGMDPPAGFRSAFHRHLLGFPRGWESAITGLSGGKIATVWHPDRR